MILLGSALSPPTVKPDGTTIARLHATLATLANEPAVIVSSKVSWATQITALRAQFAQRTSVLVVAICLMTGGVATAAVATDTLPGPTRNLAYALGLPVTSPGLYQAQTNLNELKIALTQGNRQAEVRWGQVVEHDLEKLSTDDLAEIRKPALSLLNAAGLEDPAGSSNASPSMSNTSPSTSDRNGSGDSSSDNSTTTDTVAPISSDNQDSVANSSDSSPLVPTLTLPGPTDPTSTTSSTNDESSQYSNSTSSPLLTNSDQAGGDLTDTSIVGGSSGS